MTIYQILNETNEDVVFSSPEDIREEVEMALADQFAPGASEYDEVKARYGNFDAFVDEVTRALVEMDCPEGEWGDGQVWSQIENVGFDLLYEKDSDEGDVEDYLGNDEEGTMDRLQDALF